MEMFFIFETAMLVLKMEIFYCFDVSGQYVRWTTIPDDILYISILTLQWGADHDKFNVHALNCCLKIDVKQKGNALKLDNIGEKQRSNNPNDLFQSCYIYQIFAEFECIGFCSNILCSQDMSTFVGLGFQKKTKKLFLF